MFTCICRKNQGNVGKYTIPLSDLFGVKSWTTVTEELKDEETKTWKKLMFYILDLPQQN